MPVPSSHTPLNPPTVAIRRARRSLRCATNPRQRATCGTRGARNPPPTYVIFAVVLAASSLTAILIDIVLVVSRRIVQLLTVPVSATLTIHEAR